MISAELISYAETCARKGFYGARWRQNKLSTAETLRVALKACLKATGHPDDPSYGDMAGSTVLDLASSPGIDSNTHHTYECAMNLASLADLLVTALRKETDRPWMEPKPVFKWTTDALLSPEGNCLRRLVIVSHWTPEREEAEKRSWFTLGEMAAYGLPMQLVVLVIGHERGGRRHSHWCKALQHVVDKRSVRFKRRVGNTSGGFKDSWVEVWREAHDEISRETWLNGMLKDDVLQELCFRIDLPALEQRARQSVLDLASKRLDTIHLSTESKPPLNLSTCDWPVPCQFRKCCHAIPETEPSKRLGFVEISLHTESLQADNHIAREIRYDRG